MKNTNKILPGSLCLKTMNYDLFNVLIGNRSVIDARKNKIIKSIQEVGYISSPIVVNEKYEVIDGQGRLAALKELGLPVEFIVQPGLTVEHCVAMNKFQTNWSIRDYIKSFADQGNKNYVLLCDLLECFSAIPMDVVTSIAVGHVQSGGNNNSMLKSGTVVISDDGYEAAKRMLKILESLSEQVRRISGRTDCLYMAIAFCVMHTECDAGRLIENVKKYSSKIPPIANIDSALEALENVYNYRIKASNKAYFRVDYDKFCCGAVRGYAKRWSKSGKGGK